MLFVNSVYDSLASVLALAVTLPVLALLFVSFRFYTRRMVKTPLDKDDILVAIAAWATVSVGVMLAVGAARKSLAAHTMLSGAPSSVLDWKIVEAAKLCWVVGLIGVLGLGSARLSFIYFYKRIFCLGLPTRFEKVSNLMIVVSVLWTVTFFFGFLFICGTDFPANWGPLADDAVDCPAMAGIVGSCMISDIVLDVVVFAMPIGQILSLHLSMNERLLVIVNMGFGIFVLGSAITRFVLMYTIGYDKDLWEGDLQIYYTFEIVWILVTLWGAVLTACLPFAWQWYRNRFAKVNDDNDSQEEPLQQHAGAIELSTLNSSGTVAPDPFSTTDEDLVASGSGVAGPSTSTAEQMTLDEFFKKYPKPPTPSRGPGHAGNKF